MSAADHVTTYQNPINRRTTSYFENGFLISHQDPAITKEMNSSTSTHIPKAVSASPEWYHEPSSLDCLNPAGIRAGASFPALQTSGSKISRARDSVDEGDEKPDTPRKRRRLSPIKYIKVSLRRLWPTLVHPAPRSSLPLSCGYTQSETALGQCPLKIELDRDMALTSYWEYMGYSATLDPVKPSRPRAVSSPAVLPDRSSARMRWWAPSGHLARRSTLSQQELSGSGSEQDGMSTPVSPVTQVPASPRLEGESKDDDVFMQMDALEI
ncbi:hypothetical protein MBLNU13_g00476t1 [Cladosporium sp. NU13]